MEADVKTRDSNGADGEVEKSKVIMPVDKSSIVFELKVHLGSISKNLSIIPLDQEHNFNYLNSFFLSMQGII